MSDEHQDRQNSEMPAVRTTIVGGRPPGSGVPLGSVPRGVEILIQKAAVDPDFKAVLLEKRSAAAAEIELTLQPAEAAMLDAIPAEQLEAIINNTKVPEKTRRALLGTVGLATLVALGVVAVCTPAGHRIDRPQPRGIRPDMPPKMGTETQPASNSNGSEDDTDKPKPAPTGIRPDRPSNSR
jgi:hypothetical protein